MKALIILISLALAASFARAQGGAAVRAATEIGESILRRGGTEAA